MWLHVNVFDEYHVSCCLNYFEQVFNSQKMYSRMWHTA